RRHGIASQRCRFPADRLSRRPLHPLRALRARLLPAVRPLLRRPAPWRVVLSRRSRSALRRRSRVLGQAGARPDPFHRSGRRQLRRSAPAVRHSLLTARYRRREMFTASAKLLLAALLTAGCALARAADLYVICNAHVSLSPADVRSEEHTSELQSLAYIVCSLLLDIYK